ncbi:MAG: NAD-dependent epimerase/dehydratase family protein [Deltaproteobacteria bacterium]|nr:NAD-dependent epimerase/dehydratase family protein [Deltaproteobacteria bacterium]
MGHVVVTGAAGFIGSSVVRLLLERGREVLAVIEPGGSSKNLDGMNVERVTADVTDFEKLAKVMSGADALYHLAAIYRLWLPDPNLIYKVNLDGTTTVLLAAQKAGVKRIVYTSSIAAVGLHEDGSAADETTQFNLWDDANHYIVTKYLSERIAKSFADAGLPVVIVNPAFPFGERDVAPTPTGQIVVGLLTGKVPGYGPGGFNAVDVETVALGHVLAEEKGRVGERYILGDHNVTHEEFFRLVCDVGGVKFPDRLIPGPVTWAMGWAMEAYADKVSHQAPLTTYRTMRYGSRLAFFDPGKARRELGLPSTPLRATVQKAVRWFRDNGYTK